MTPSPMALGALLIYILLNALLVYSQSGGVVKTVIANSDPQMSYAPAYCSAGAIANCFGAWWDSTMDDGTVIKTTAGPSSQYKNAQSTLSFTFYGSNLELHGLADADGANMIIQLDNFLTIVNTSTGADGSSLQPCLIYNSSILNSQTVHTLSIGWSKNNIPDTDAGGYNPLSFAYFDHLVVSDYRAVDAVSPSPFSSVSSGSTGDTSPTADASSAQLTSAKLKPGALAGIIIAPFLCTMLFCAFSVCLLRHHRRRPLLRRRSTSPHAKITIESDEIRFVDVMPSPTASASWKAHPHLSLPPAYIHTKGDGSDEVEYGAEKGVSYLDLEAGSTKSMDGLSSLKRDPSDAPKKGKRKFSQLPSLILPLRSPRITLPPRAKLHASTRESTFSPHVDPFASYTVTQIQEEQRLSPVTPFTPYYVTIATVARLQNAQLISEASLSSGGGSSSGPVLDAPLPPLPPIPSPREEKRRLAKLRSSPRNPRAISGSRNEGVTDTQASDAVRLFPGSNALELELGATADNARPSFDAMSIMTRSVPPPYALHA